MINSTTTRGPLLTHNVLAMKYLHWGLKIFIFGFVVGFIPILHYTHVAMEGDVGPAFLKNVTLWWGCPIVLAEQALKAGGLGMVAIGLSYVVFMRGGAGAAISSGERVAPALCAFGLIGEFLAALIGYFVCSYFWPNFYFDAVPVGKNIWLATQGTCLAFYVAGTFYAFGGIRRLSHGWAKEPDGSSLP
jgi:hypothetical protein